MATNRSGTAYDLSRYEPVEQPAPSQPAVQEVPLRKKKRGRAFTIRLQSMSSFVIVVVMFGLIVLNQVWLTEISGEISAINDQMRELESEQARMLSELESTVSLRTIGEQAKSELGMNRLSPHQIIHITLEQEDKIELAEDAPSPSLGKKAQLALSEFIGSIQEYIGSEQNIIE